MSSSSKENTHRNRQQPTRRAAASAKVALMKEGAFARSFSAGAVYVDQITDSEQEEEEEDREFDHEEDVDNDEEFTDVAHVDEKGHNDSLDMLLSSPAVAKDSFPASSRRRRPVLLDDSEDDEKEQDEDDEDQGEEESHDDEESQQEEDDDDRSQEDEEEEDVADEVSAGKGDQPDTSADLHDASGFSIEVDLDSSTSSILEDDSDDSFTAGSDSSANPAESADEDEECDEDSFIDDSLLETRPPARKTTTARSRNNRGATSSKSHMESNSRSRATPKRTSQKTAAAAAPPQMRPRGMAPDSSEFAGSGSERDNDVSSGDDESAAAADGGNKAFKAQLAKIDDFTGVCNFCDEKVPEDERQSHAESCGLTKDFCSKCSGWILLQEKQRHIESNCAFGAIVQDSLALAADANDDLSVPEWVHPAMSWSQKDRHPDRWYMNHGFWIPDSLYQTLAPHQRDGVGFLWNLYREKKGAVLGDEMGLGKTIQAVTYVAGLANARSKKRDGSAALVIVSKSLLDTWEKEFKKWAGIDVVRVHDGTPKKRKDGVDQVRQYGGVIVTTYNIVLKNIHWFTPLSLTKRGPQDSWDTVILDEGHLIKNHTSKIAKALRQISSRNRVVLSGTIVQNNLTELWAIFDYVCKGELLGKIRTFKASFETPIVQGSKKNAKPEDMRQKNRMQGLLRSRIAPHHLRRDRKQLEAQHSADALLRPTESRLSDYVVWLRITPAQEELTKALLSSEIVQQANETKNPLTLVSGLRTITTHPMLLRTKHNLISQLPRPTLERWGVVFREHKVDHESEHDHSPYVDLSKLEDFVPLDRDDPMHIEQSLPDEILLRIFSFLCRRTDELNASAVCRRWYYVLRVEVVNPQSAKYLMETSAKMSFISHLLPQLFVDGHRVLVFGEQRRTLDMVGAFLRANQLKYVHIDGTTSAPNRQRAVDRFNAETDATSSDRLFAFLVTTGCGSVGLTLTGANRVIIMDPSWNPSSDAQAVHRAYRIGQKRDVVCYRLITNGTIEETVYKRQVFKRSLEQSAMKGSTDRGMFTHNDLYNNVFTLGNLEASETRQTLLDRAMRVAADATHESATKAARQLSEMEALESSLRALPPSSHFTGLSDHTLLFLQRKNSSQLELRAPEIEDAREGDDRTDASHDAEASSVSLNDNDADQAAFVAATSKSTPLRPVVNKRVVGLAVSATPKIATPDEPIRAPQSTPVGPADKRLQQVGTPRAPTTTPTTDRGQTPRHPYGRRIFGSPTSSSTMATPLPQKNRPVPTTGAISRSLRSELLDHSVVNHSIDEEDCHTTSCANQHTFLTGVIVGAIAGKGHFSVVFAGHYRGKKVALKRLLNQTSLSDKEFQHEVNMLSKLKHPNILDYMGLYRNVNGTYIVTEWMQCSVSDFLAQSQSGDLSVVELLTIIHGAGCGMKFLAELDPPVLHRDLAARNLLICDNREASRLSHELPPFTVKVSDFGMARSLYGDDSFYTASNRTIAANWAAPESLKYKRFSVASEVYSFGVTAWEVLTLGLVPYHHINGALDPAAAIKAIQKGEVLPPLDPEFHCPESVYDNVLLPCWAMDPMKRPSFKQVVGRIEVEIECLNDDLDSEQEDEGFEASHNDFYVGDALLGGSSGSSSDSDEDSSNSSTSADSPADSATPKNSGQKSTRSLFDGAAPAAPLTPRRIIEIARAESPKRLAHRLSVEFVMSPNSSVRSPQVRRVDLDEILMEQAQDVDISPAVSSSSASLFKWETRRALRSLSDEKRQAYNDLLVDGETHEAKNNLDQALLCCLRALEICDEDAGLHAKCVQLGAYLNLL